MTKTNLKNFLKFNKNFFTIFNIFRISQKLNSLKLRNLCKKSHGLSSFPFTLSLYRSSSKLSTFYNSLLLL